MAGILGKRVYSSARWRMARLAALERDGYRCRECGRAGRLEVHHVTSLESGGPAFALDNLKSVCRPCHFGEHNGPVASARARFREWALAEF